MTALSGIFSLMIICDVFSLSIPTFLLFSQVGKPILDTKQENNSGSTQGKTSESKEPNPNLSLKLSKDSKLMPQECQLWLNNNLCLFCGIPGHIAKGSSKASVAKAHT